MNKVLLVFTILCFSQQISAQNFGGFRPRTKWKQINTDTARVIFTPKSEVEAERVATIINRMAATEKQIGEQLQKVDIILHSNTTLANGFVTLGPFRSEFFLVPGGNIFQFGNLPWQDLLAIHEYRHVQQYNNFNRGLSKAFGWVFGQGGRALANSLAIPDWFWEGDAVYAETALTTQGRGRMPYFLNAYNSLWKEGRDYSWMKLRNGSLKDMVPNHYQLGYLLTNYGYEKYGDDFWQKVTRDASAFKGLIYPFQRAVKTHSGVNFKTFRNDALQYYSHGVAKRRDDITKSETVTNYQYPQVIGEDSIVYLKNSYKSLPAFYIRTGDVERKIKLKRISSEDWFSYRNGMIAYTSYSTHARWSLEDYSDIILLNVTTGAEEKIIRRGKYYTPDISPDGNSVLAVHINDSLQSELQLLSRDGELIKKIKAPAHSLFVHPRFLDANTAIVGIRLPDATMTLQRFDLNTEQGENLLPPTKATIGFTSVSGDKLFFVSSLKGNDDIYSLDLNTKAINKLTAGQIGFYYPSVSGNQVIYSAFTANGYRLRTDTINNLKGESIQPSDFTAAVDPVPVAKAETSTNLLKVPTKAFPVSQYRKGTGFFNFHSWTPFTDDPEFGFSIYSNNILSTFANDVSYTYNRNEKSHAAAFNASYAGWFPVINAGVEYTWDRHVPFQGRTLTLNQTEGRIGFSIPLNATQGRMFKVFNLGSNFVINHYTPTGPFKDSVRVNNSNYMHYFGSMAFQLPRARQHIFPKFGLGTGQQVRQRLDESGYQYAGTGYVMLPSAFPTHSIVLLGGLQETDTSNIIFTNRFANSRGYNEYFFSRMWRGSANYHFPIAYPDFGFANIVYFQRLRANAFYDHTKVYSSNKLNTALLRSVGTEIFFDTKWWNQLPISFGVRYSYLLDEELQGKQKKHVWEFIVPLDLIPR
jgi:hypothetical protein